VIELIRSEGARDSIDSPILSSNLPTKIKESVFMIKESIIILYHFFVHRVKII